MLISFLKMITVDRRESFGKLVRLNRAAKVLRIILVLGNGAASIVSRGSYAVLVRYRCIDRVSLHCLFLASKVRKVSGAFSFLMHILATSVKP